MNLPEAIADLTDRAFMRWPVGGPLAYLRGSWLAWLLVAAVTVGLLTGWLAAGTGPARTAGTRPSGHAELPAAGGRPGQ